MKIIDKKIVDLAKGIFAQRIAADHMAPGSRNESAISRASEFERVALRAFEAASSFMAAHARLEADEPEMEAIVPTMPLRPAAPAVEGLVINKQV